MKNILLAFLFIAVYSLSATPITLNQYETNWRPDIASERVVVSGGEFITVLVAASTTEWNKKLFVVIKDNNGVEHPIIWDELPSSIEEESGTYIVGFYKNQGAQTIQGEVLVKVGLMNNGESGNLHENNGAANQQAVESIIMISAAEPTIESAVFAISNLATETYSLSGTVENFVPNVVVPTKADANKFWAHIHLNPQVFLEPLPEVNPGTALTQTDTEVNRLIPVSLQNEASCLSQVETTLSLQGCILQAPSVPEGNYRVVLGIETIDNLSPEGTFTNEDVAKSLFKPQPFLYFDANRNSKASIAQIYVPKRATDVVAPTIFAAATSDQSDESRKVFIRWAPHQGLSDAIDGYKLTWRNAQGVSLSDAEVLYLGKEFRYELDVPSLADFTKVGEAHVLDSYVYDVSQDIVGKPSNYSLTNAGGVLSAIKKPQDQTLNASTFANSLTLTLEPVQRSWTTSPTASGGVDVKASFIPVRDNAGAIIAPLVISGKALGLAESNPQNTNKLSLAPKVYDASENRVAWDGTTPFQVSLDDNLVIPIDIIMNNVEPFWDNTASHNSPYLFGQMQAQLLSSPDYTAPAFQALSSENKEIVLKSSPKVNAFHPDFMFVADADLISLKAGTLTGQAQNFIHEAAMTFRPDPKTVLCGDVHPKIPAYKIKQEQITHTEYEIGNTILSGNEEPTTTSVIEGHWVLDLDEKGVAQIQKDLNGKVLYIDDLDDKDKVGPNKDRSLCARLAKQRDDANLPLIPAREIPVEVRSKVGEYKIRFNANNLAYRGPLATDYATPSYGSYIELPVLVLPPKPNFVSFMPKDVSEFNKGVDVKYIVEDRSQDLELSIDYSSVNAPEALSGKTILSIYNNSGKTIEETGALLWEGELSAGTLDHLLLQEKPLASSAFSEAELEQLKLRKFTLNFGDLSGRGTFAGKTLFDVVTSDAVHTLKLALSNEEKGMDGNDYQSPKTYIPYLVNYLHRPEVWECADLVAPVGTDAIVASRRSNFLGIYPRSSAIDKDFVFAFTRIYDLNPNHWTVDVEIGSTLLSNVPFILDANGFTLNMEAILEAKGRPELKVAGQKANIYAYMKGVTNTKCPTSKSNTLKASVTLTAATEGVIILQEGNSFTITNIDPSQKVEYAIGRTGDADWRNKLNFQSYPYNEVTQKGKAIDVSYSALLTVSVTPKALFQGQRDLVHKVIKVNTDPTIYDHQNLRIAPEPESPYTVPAEQSPYTYPASGLASLDAQVFVQPSFLEWRATSQVRYLCQIDADAPFLCPLGYEGLLLNQPGEHTLRVWAQTHFLDEFDQLLEHSSLPLVLATSSEILSKEEIVPGLCYDENYPLLLKLNATNMPSWNSSDWANVSQSTLIVRSKQDVPLAFELEHVSSQEAWLWVSSPKVDSEEEGCGVKVALSSTAYSSQPKNVWQDYYRGVYHFQTNSNNPNVILNALALEPNLTTSSALGKETVIAEGVTSQGKVIDVPASETLITTWDNGFTWSAWVRHNDISTATQNISLLSASNSVVSLAVSLNAAIVGNIGKNQFLSETNSFISGEWNHVAMTFDRSTSPASLKVFLNGKMIIEDQTLSAQSLPFHNDIEYQVTSNFDYVDEVRFSAIALPDQWISWDYITQHPAGLKDPKTTNCSPIILGLSDRFQANCDLQVGDQIFTDLMTSFNQLPDEMLGAVQIRTANVENFVNHAEYLEFETRQSSVVYVLLDPNYTQNPSFLLEDNWSQVSFAKSVLSSRNESFEIWQKTVSPMEKVILGGPRHGGALGNKWNYSVVIANSKAKVLNSCGTLNIGSKVYSDRDWNIVYASGLPAQDILCTKQDDYNSTSSESFSISLAETRYIYVGIDTQTDGLPEFLNGSWAKVPNAKLALNAPDHEGYIFYKTTMHAGTHTLSGMRTGASNNTFNYVVLAEKSEIDFPDEPTNTITEPSQIGNISILDLSAVLDGTKGRQACKDIENPFSPVRIVGPARVYAAYPDASYPKTFAYLEDNAWALTNLHILVAAYEQPLKVWSKDIPQGVHTVLVPCHSYEDGWKDKEYPLVIVGPIYQEIVGFRMQNMQAVVNPIEKVQSSEFIIDDLEFSWAKGVASNSLYSLELNAIAAIHRPITSRFVLTGKGINGSQSVQTSTGEVLIAQSLNLVDLLPQMMDDRIEGQNDNIGVVVSAENLEASGVVRLHFTNAGKSDLKQKFNVILFDDLDGNFIFDADYDSYLGEATITEIGQGEELFVDIPVYNHLSFPEKSIMAFMDPESWVAESNKLNNVLLSNLKCSITETLFDREGEGWKLINAVESQVPQNASVQLGLLKDDNQDGSITDEDKRYLVVADGITLKALESTTGVELFSQSFTGSSQNIQIRDVNSDGTPEIILDHEVRTNLGASWIDFANVSTWKSIDLDHDQIVDPIVIGGNCTQITSGATGSVLASLECANPTSLAAVQHLNNSETPCIDLSLSYPRKEGTTLIVRFANNSNVVLTKAIPLSLYAQENGVWVKKLEASTEVNLNPEKIQDILFDLGASFNWSQSLKVVIEKNQLGTVPYFEFNVNNNSLEYTP